MINQFQISNNNNNSNIIIPNDKKSFEMLLNKFRSNNCSIKDTFQLGIYLKDGIGTKVNNFAAIRCFRKVRSLLFKRGG